MIRKAAFALLLSAFQSNAAWCVQWDFSPAIERVAFYRVWYAPLALAKMGQFVPMGKDSTTNLVQIPTNLTIGQVYAFRVTAVNAFGESDPSDYVTFTAAGGTSRPSKLGLPRLVEKP